MKSDRKKKWKKLWGKTPNSKINAQKSQNLRTSGPTPVARGGSGAKDPPLAAPTKQRWQAGCWLHECVLRNTLAGSKTWFLCPGMTLYECLWNRDSVIYCDFESSFRKRSQAI